MHAHSMAVDCSRFQLSYRNLQVTYMPNIKPNAKPGLEKAENQPDLCAQLALCAAAGTFGGGGWK